MYLAENLNTSVKRTERHETIFHGCFQRQDMDFQK